MASSCAKKYTFYMRPTGDFIPARTHCLYRVGHHLADLHRFCLFFLSRYCFACHILLGQVGIWQDGQDILAAMVETTKSESTKDSPRGKGHPVETDVCGHLVYVKVENPVINWAAATAHHLLAEHVANVKQKPFHNRARTCHPV